MAGSREFGLAEIEHGAWLALLSVVRRRSDTRRNQGPDATNRGQRCRSHRRVKGNLAPLSRGRVIDRARGNGAFEHLLKAHRLRTDLDVVSEAALLGTTLVLDRVRRPSAFLPGQHATLLPIRVQPELHDVHLAGDAETQGTNPEAMTDDQSRP